MSGEMANQLCYPYNLLLAAKGQRKLELPQRLSADVLAGLRYALSTLPDIQQELLRLHYSGGKPLPQIAASLSIPLEQAESLHANALKKLRAASRWNYIQYGIVGWHQKEAAIQYNKGYHAGYMAAVADSHRGLSPSDVEKNAMNQPIEFLELSPRAYHCLNRAGYKYIREVAAIKGDKILFIRGLGRIGADEIAKALLAAGVTHTAWFEYLL